MKILQFLKNWALLLSILIGCIGHSWLIQFASIVPYILFSMLLFTFCRITPQELKFKKMHLWFLLIQIGGGLILYMSLSPFNIPLAEGLMMCVLAPTAAASAVVTMKLGGDGANNTTYVLISSMAVAIIAPLLFPIIHPMPEHPNFWIACWSILKRVMPVLIGPFVLATILHIILPKVHEKLATWHEVSFYLWSLCLVFAAAQTVEALLQEKSQTGIELLLAGFSGIICIILFSIGKHVGGIYGKRISGGQSLGQKNVVLAIWIAQSYLTPIASTGLGAYIIWQNIFNSYQLWKKRQEEQKGNEHPSDFELIP